MCAAFLTLPSCSDAIEGSDDSEPPGGDAQSGGAFMGGSGGSISSSVGGTASGGHAPSGMSGGASGSSGSTNTGGASTGAGGDDGSGGEPSGSGGGSSLAVDVFGIPLLKATKPSGSQWNSLHWGTGDERTFSSRDPSDPTGWSIKRGDANLMAIDGSGVLSMGGVQPRIYFQPEAGDEPFFRDIEFTGYYRRTADDGASNAGFSVGVRAHVNGHGNVDHCLATTYGLVFKNSGSWVFYKELDHPNSVTRQGGQVFPGGGAISVGEWIGMKFLVYNLPGDTAVKLEAWVDTESNGDGTSPDDWRKLGETVDDSDWSAPAGDCGYPSTTVITQGGGVAFIRNTDVSEVQYTKVSWREIVNEPASP